MIPIQAFLLVAATLFSLGLYCFIISDSKFAYLLGGQFCLGSICLVLASGARYLPNQESFIFWLAITLYSVAQLSTAAAIFFFPRYGIMTTKEKNTKGF